MRTIRILTRENFPLGIRTTITKNSVKKMPDILRFFSSIVPNGKFHFEPLFECGRCFVTKSSAPGSEDFFEYFIKARRVAKELSVKLYYSGSELENIHPTFCGAAGKNFFVTPSGNVTTCLEVSREEDNLAGIFIIGRYNPNFNLFEFDLDRINQLQMRVVTSMDNCKDCYAKYNCAGDCLAKTVSSSGNLYDSTKNLRCSINKMVLLDEIKEKLKK